MEHQQESESRILRDLLPAYGMGITDAEETHLVETFLKEQPEAATELDAYRALADAMLSGVPQVEPPADLGKSVLSAAASQPTIIRFTRRSLVIGASAAAAIFALLVLNIVTARQIVALKTEQQALSDQMHVQVAMLNVLVEGDTYLFELPDIREDGGDAHAVIICNLTTTIGLLKVENFPVLSPDNAYQVWLSNDEERVSGGMFQVDADGSSVFIVSAPDLMERYEYLGITAEPASGSDGPTSPPIVRGTLYVGADDW